MENTEVTKIPFKTNRIPDSTKPVGDEVVVQDGVDGTHTVVTVDGHVTSDRTIAPKNAVVYYGTKEDEDVSTPELPQEEVQNDTPQITMTQEYPSAPVEAGNPVQEQGRFSQTRGILKLLGNNMNSNAILVRAFKTFVQTALATWALTNFDFGKAALIGAAAAGISAVMNLFIQPLEAK